MNCRRQKGRREGRRGCAATWDASSRLTLKVSAESMAQGAAMRDAEKMSSVEESAKVMTTRPTPSGGIKESLEDRRITK